MSDTQYIVFDKDGIVHSSTDYDAARKEFEETDKFTDDLVFAKVLAVRR